MNADGAAAQTGDVRKIWSSVPQLIWISDSPVPAGMLSITVNSKPLTLSAPAINSYDDSTHVRIPLEHGMSNDISVNEGDRVLYRADVFYAPTYEGGLVPEEYVMYPFHSEHNEEPCRDCHRMKVEFSDVMPSSPSDSLCYTCHKREFTGDLVTQHREAGVSWECLRCHQAEPMETDFSIEGPVKYAVSGGSRVAPLCYKCHINKEKEHAEFKYVHGPVAMSGCNMCHNPHGSKNKRLLQKEISTLCIECHRLEGIMDKPKVHAPLIKGGCTACHDPHGSNFKLFLSADIIGTCFSCHPGIREKGNNHPITGHPVSGPSDPSMEDSKFSCVSCHNPHSSEYNKLLPGAEPIMICMKCHPSPMKG